MESAVNQGEYVSEIVIADNASDYQYIEYLEIAKSLSGKVVVYNQSINVGATGNWLSGLRKVKTEWVKILFSDDFLESDCLKKMFSFQNEYELDVLVSSAHGFVDGIACDFYSHSKLISRNFSEMAELVANRVLPVSPTAALLRTKDALFELEGMSNLSKLTNSAIGPDLVMIYGPVAKGGKFGFLDKRLVTMFGDGQNISSIHSKLLPGYYAEAFLYMTSQYHYRISLYSR